MAPGERFSGEGERHSAGADRSKSQSARLSFIATPEPSSGQLVEKEIKGGDPAVPGNDEVSPGVSWRFTRAARYPSDPPAIPQLLWLDNWLISKVRVSRLDSAATRSISSRPR